jgi:2-phosphosulfolactate phosphatase
VQEESIRDLSRTWSKKHVQVDVYFSVKAFEGVIVGDRWVAVIDVLRAGTSIAYALMNGARAVLPTDSSEEALRIAGNLPREDVVLCGERGGLPIPGFEFGNSPREFTSDLVRDKTVIMTTSNGTQGLVRSGLGERLVVPALVNIYAAVTYLAPRVDESGLSVLCCGSEGRLALEDMLCAGLLIERLESSLSEKISGNDGFSVARTLARLYGSTVEEVVLKSDHGKELIDLDLEDDVRMCSQVSSMHVLPVGRNGRLVKAEEL